MSEYIDIQEKDEKIVLDNLINFWEKNGKEVIDQLGDLIIEWPEDLEKRDMTYFSFQKKLTASSVLVLTANQIESNMMVRLLSIENKGPLLTYTTKDDCIYRFGTIDDLNIVHLQPQNEASFTKKGSFNAVKNALKRFRPKLVISLGVAFGGNPERQNLGDVLIAKRLYVYDARNKRSDGKLTLDINNIYETDSNLVCRWMNPLSYKKFPGKEEVKFDWYFGTMFSGGTVLSDAEERNKLFYAAESTGNEIIGGEMEGSGIYFYCKNYKIPCIVIKGICDWGVLKNGWMYVLEKQDVCYGNNFIKDCVQAMAMKNAFYAFKYLIQYDKNMFTLEKEWKHFWGWMRLKKVFVFNKFAIKKKQFRFLLVFLFLMIGLVIGYRYYILLYYFLENKLLTVLLYITLFIYMIVSIRWYLKYLSVPDNAILEVAHITFSELGFGRCFCTFEIIDDFELENVKIMWLSKKQYSPVRSFYYSIIKRKILYSIGYKYSSENSARDFKDDFCPIKPDTLQIEYDLDGKRIYHIIKINILNRIFSIFFRKKTYMEYVSMEMGNKIQKLYQKKCYLHP